MFTIGNKTKLFLDKIKPLKRIVSIGIGTLSIYVGFKFYDKSNIHHQVQLIEKFDDDVKKEAKILEPKEKDIALSLFTLSGVIILTEIIPSRNYSIIRSTKLMATLTTMSWIVYNVMYYYIPIKKPEMLRLYNIIRNGDDDGDDEK